MFLDNPLFKTHRAKQIVPIGILFALGYLDFASGYALGYKEIYRHHSTKVAILFWCLLGICQFNTLLYWLLVFIVGPGRAPSFPPLNIYGEANNDELISLPDLFFCDDAGYPYYCSHSQSIKIVRSFFLKDVGYNVLKFDHYCIWVGIPLGESNYLFFIKYMFWFLSYFMVILVFVAIYTQSSVKHGEIDHNFIVLYIMSGFWIIMIGTLLIAHYRYICYNLTTLDDITLQQRKRYNNWKLRGAKGKSPRVELGNRYVNVRRGDKRYVVPFDIKEKPFDMGVKKNWMNLILNGNRNHGRNDDWYSIDRLLFAIFVLIMPYVDIPLYFYFKCGGPLRMIDDENGMSKLDQLLKRFEVYNEVVSDRFIELINRKIENRECYPPKYLAKKLLVGKEGT